MWQQHQTVIYKLGHTPLPSNIKMMAFDYDGTLHISDRCEKYPVTSFIWAYDKIPEYFQMISQLGYIIVIFSNRSNAHFNIKEVKYRLECIMRECQVPISIFLSTAKDNFRKPNTGMLELFKSLYNINTIEGIFCGDAAGETSNNPAHKWNDSDINFAINAKLTFVEPHMIFGRFPNQNIPNSKCLVTVGVYLPFKEGEDYILNNIRYIGTSTYNPKLDYQIVIGQHPKYKDRIMPVDYTILWYPKLDGEHHDKHFSEKFEFFKDNEIFIRMN
jgi:DNA 3'-phosphatase